MSEIMTVVNPPGRGAHGEGLALHGRQTRAHIIEQMRAMYVHNLEVAQRILAMADDEFEVSIVRGVHRQHLIERLHPLAKSSAAVASTESPLPLAGAEASPAAALGTGAGP